MAAPKEEELSNEFKTVKALKDKNDDEFRMLLLEDLEVNKLDNYNKKSKTKEKETLLHVAIRCKNIKAVEKLVKFKADVNIKSFPSGNTPMHYAAFYAEDKIVEFLLSKGAISTENNNNGKNPLQVIGSRLKDKNSGKSLNKTTETQILLLTAGAKKAESVQKEISDDVDDAKTGFNQLKNISNAKIKAVAKAQKKNFDSTHPYLYCKTDRIKVWEQNNKTTIRDFLSKKMINIRIPMWSLKDTTHIDLSNVESFQITMTITLLETNGLKLFPEPFPGKPPKNAKIWKDTSNIAKNAKKKSKLSNVNGSKKKN